MIADDEMALDYQERDLALNLKLVASRPDKGPGSPVCLECGEFITGARMQAGAKLCVPCNEEADRLEACRQGKRA